MSTEIQDRLAALAPDEEVLRARTDRLRSQVLPMATTSSAKPTRRRFSLLAVGVAAAFVATVVVGTTVFLDRATPQNRYDDAAPGAAYDTYGAFSIGRTLFIGNHEVTFDENVKALYYTAEGVLVRTGKSNAADDDGPSHYTLVSPSGRRWDLRLTLGDVVPATDPTSPYFAYAAPTDDPERWELVRVDLRRFADVGAVSQSLVDCATCDSVTDARTAVSGAFTWGGWDAPPVATAGGRVWALMDKGWIEWDGAAGSVRGVPRDAELFTPLATGGTRYVAEAGGATGAQYVLDFVTGERVATVPARTQGEMEDGPGTPELSPEGGFAKYDEQPSAYDENGTLLEPHRGAKLLDLDTGRRTPLAPGEWGWSPDGHAIQVEPDKNRVIVCDGATGRCETIERDLPSGAVRVGGRYYGT